LQLARQLDPRHRDLFLKWADEWKTVAEELEEQEEFKQQAAREDQFGEQQKKG
jgi:hypothetical protein